jgi:ankyrin repeat protein
VAQVAAGADVTLRDSQGASALTFAAEAAHVEAVRLLLGALGAAAAAAVDQRDSEGQTPLARVAQFGPVASTSDVDAVAVASLLLDAGADVNVADNDGDTPLILAAKARNVPLVQRLLARGAATDATNNDFLTAAAAAEAALVSVTDASERATLERVVALCTPVGEAAAKPTATATGGAVGANLARRKRQKKR